MKKQTIAYHEAGHAVVAHRLRYQVDGASIVSTERGQGRVNLPNPIYRMDPDNVRHRFRFEHKAIMTLAGPLTQKRYSPRSHWRKGGSGYGKFTTKGTDFQVVSDLIHRVHGDGKVAETFWSYLEAQTERLVDQNWSAIERVAQALLKQGTLSRGELRMAIQGSYRPPITKL